MTFKEQVAADIGTVFFNLGEFAEVLTINGKEMDGIFDDYELVERKKGAGTSSASTSSFGRAPEGIYQRNVLLYVRADQFGAEPKPSSVMSIEGKGLYTVTDCTSEAGVYAITLVARRN